MHLRREFARTPAPWHAQQQLPLLQALGQGRRRVCLAGSQGLRVRMGLATGRVEALQQHKMTGRVEYRGGIMRRVEAVAAAPAGGQGSERAGGRAGVAAALAAAQGDCGRGCHVTSLQLLMCLTCLMCGFRS